MVSLDHDLCMTYPAVVMTRSLAGNTACPYSMQDGVWDTAGSIGRTRIVLGNLGGDMEDNHCRDVDLAHCTIDLVLLADAEREV